MGRVQKGSNLVLKSSGKFRGDVGKAPYFCINLISGINISDGSFLNLLFKRCSLKNRVVFFLCHPAAYMYNCLVNVARLPASIIDVKTFN
jgi:hypothetical protein